MARRRRLQIAITLTMALAAASATAQADVSGFGNGDPSRSATERTGDTTSRTDESGGAAPSVDDGFDQGSGTDKPRRERSRGDRSRDRVGSGPRTVKVSTTVERKETFFRGIKPARFNYRVMYKDADTYSDHDIEAKVELVRAGNKDVVQRWREPVADAAKHSVRWKGKAKEGTAKEGKYKFDIKVLVDGDPDASKIRNAGGGSSTSETVSFHLNQFPIDGKHDLGGGGAGKFGAGRNGHRHQGQDAFAKCGTPLVAARGGKVQANQFQSAAGFYIVIDEAGSKEDHFYAHMKKRSKLKTGDEVKTGQQIGVVGHTGDAQGCHLHFEEWTKPGWFEGGKAYDPLKDMKKWDRYS